MDKELKEKLQDPGLAEKMKKETNKITEELYLKDLKYAAGILDIPIDEEGSTICTRTMQTQFLIFVYGILQHQIAKLETAKNNVFADIKEQNSKVAEGLINLKLS